MALIKCPECGQMVSDKADVCIHCGFPLKKKTFDHLVLVIIHQDPDRACDNFLFDGKKYSSSDDSFQSEPGFHTLELPFYDFNALVSPEISMVKNPINIVGEARQFDIYLKCSYSSYSGEENGPYGYWFDIDRLTYLR
jgi:RNA polymerase subunit RPABC4/transcription elongation factor Spt4